jgi:Protein of unknown function (DUF3995)
VIHYLALLGALVFAVLAGVHIYWAFGAHGVFPAAVPTRTDGTPVLTPGPVASLAVAFLLLCAGFLLAEQGGWSPGVLPPFWRRTGTAGIAVVMALRGIGDFRYVGLFKRRRDTPFARMDTRVYTPLVFSLALIAGIVAAAGG